jgi:predicted cobalt transporter CbtA
VGEDRTGAGRLAGLVTITAIALLPTYTEVPADFPATVLYEFRMASLATQLSLWATIGLALGELFHRRQHRTDLQVSAPGSPNSRSEMINRSGGEQ